MAHGGGVSDRPQPGAPISAQTVARILLQSPSGHTVLIDGGGHGNEPAESVSQDEGEKTVVPFLRSKGIGKIDIVVLTHPHGDHVGGLLAVLRDEKIGCVVDGHVQPYPSTIYADFEKEVADDHIRDVRAVRGMKIDLGDGVKLEELNPPAAPMQYGSGTDDTTVNDYSVVLRVSLNKVHLMLDRVTPRSRGRADQYAQPPIPPIISVPTSSNVATTDHETPVPTSG